MVSLAFNTRGNAVLDTFFILVSLFVIGLVIVLMHTVQSEVNLDMQNDTALSNQSRDYMQSQTNSMPSLFDGLFIFILVGIWIVALVAAALTDTNPIFLIVTIIILLLLVVVAAIISNAFQDTVADADLAAYAAEFPMLLFVTSHLVTFIVAIFFTIALVLFGKRVGT